MSEERALELQSSTHPSSLIPHLFLFLICTLYLIVAALFALYTPPWQTPDEPPHYNYIAQVAANGCCPVIEMGDWKLRYQNQLTSQHFAPELLGDLNTLQYEDHQPPLYYLLASVVFRLTNGSLIALRLFSVLISLGVVLSAYGVGRVMYPERPWIALSTAALVAFLPQHVAMMASVNNDGLAEVVIGVTLLATICYLLDDSARPRIRPWHLGILVGIGLLTKVSTLFLAGVVPLAILLKWWMENKNGVGARRILPVQTLLARLALFLIPALLLGSIWWLRNLNVYGWPDFLGLGRHNLVVADQLRTADKIAAIGWSAYLREAFWTTFNSFWGQFGWMAVPMPQWIYRAVQLLLLVVISGLVIEVAILRKTSKDVVVGRGEPPVRPYVSDTISPLTRRSAWLVLGVTLALALAAFVYYNTEFVQYQGRYLFPGLIPFALLMALGVDGWRRALEYIIGRRRGASAVRPYLGWLTPTVFLAFAALDVYLLWRVIVPGLSP